jgi:excisionase family DNA binding protein
MTTEKRDYTVPEAAKMMACSNGTVKNWIRQGKLKAYRLGGPTGRHYRIPWAEVERIRAEWLYSPETEQAL